MSELSKNRQIQCKIQGRAKKVILEYSYNNGQSWSEIEMDRNNIDGQYYAELPILPTTTNILYYFKAIDFTNRVMIDNNRGKYYSKMVLAEQPFQDSISKSNPVSNFPSKGYYESNPCYETALSVSHEAIAQNEKDFALKYLILAYYHLLVDRKQEGISLRLSQVCYDIAEIHFDKKDFWNALKWYRRAAYIDSDNISLIRSGFDRERICCSNLNSNENHNSLGLIQPTMSRHGLKCYKINQEKKFWDESIAQKISNELDQAIHAEPKNPIILMTYAFFLKEMKIIENRLKFQTGAPFQPNDGKIDRALKMLRSALDLDRSISYIWLLYGKILFKCQFFTEADKAFTRSYHLEPDSFLILDEIKFYYAQGPIAMKLCELSPFDWQPAFYKGIEFHKKGDFENALMAYGTSIELALSRIMKEPHNSKRRRDIEIFDLIQSYEYRAHLELDLNDDRAAMKDILEIGRITDLGIVEHLLGKLFHMKGEYSKAISLYQTSLTKPVLTTEIIKNNLILAQERLPPKKLFEDYHRSSSCPFCNKIQSQGAIKCFSCGSSLPKKIFFEF